MGTASIPGTGISYRQHFNLASAASGQETPTPTPHSYPGAPPASPSGFPTPGSVPVNANLPIEDVHSASTELLTSASLKDVKNLLQMTFEEREDITRQLTVARAEQQRASKRYQAWEDGFLFKRILKKAFAKRKEEFEVATARVAESDEQLRLTTVVAHIQIETEQGEPYYRMRDEFARICECAAIWDIKSHQGVDQFHERTTAIMKVARTPVRFSVDSCDLIQWEEKVPHLANAKGGDIFLFPGFILYRAAKEAFSVIDYHDIRGEAKVIPFHEEDGVPSIAQYGYAILRSAGGLWEEFQFSNPERLSPFLNSMNAFVASFSKSAAAHATVQ
jgi:hypothetical protein